MPKLELTETSLEQYWEIHDNIYYAYSHNKVRDIQSIKDSYETFKRKHPEVIIEADWEYLFWLHWVLLEIEKVDGPKEEYTNVWWNRNGWPIIQRLKHPWENHFTSDWIGINSASGIGSEIILSEAIFQLKDPEEIARFLVEFIIFKSSKGEWCNWSQLLDIIFEKIQKGPSTKNINPLFARTMVVWNQSKPLHYSDDMWEVYIKYRDEAFFTEKTKEWEEIERKWQESCNAWKAVIWAALLFQNTLKLSKKLIDKLKGITRDNLDEKFDALIEDTEWNNHLTDLVIQIQAEYITWWGWDISEWRWCYIKWYIDEIVQRLKQPFSSKQQHPLFRHIQQSLPKIHSV